MNVIRLYVEGAGETEATKRPLRQGLSVFFRQIRAQAKLTGVKFDIVLCRDAARAFDDFKNALDDSPADYQCVLVDSEAPVQGAKLSHYQARFKGPWKRIREEHCHLMVQMMESWFLADPRALLSFYAEGFNPNPLPMAKDLETVDKATVLKVLETATSKTKKGKYHKIRHASQLLALVDPEAVRKASRHCDLLFKTLESVIGNG